MFGFGKQRENDRMAQIIQGRLDALVHRPDSETEATEVPDPRAIEETGTEFEQVLKAS